MECFETRLLNISKHDEEKAVFIAVCSPTVLYLWKRADLELQDLLKHVRVLSDEKSKIQKQLDLSQYLCQKQVEDLKSIKQQVTGLQRSMVRLVSVDILSSSDVMPELRPIRSSFDRWRYHDSETDIISFF